jgi:hypothetical protein
MAAIAVPTEPVPSLLRRMLFLRSAPHCNRGATSDHAFFRLNRQCAPGKPLLNAEVDWPTVPPPSVRRLSVRKTVLLAAVEPL